MSIVKYCTSKLEEVYDIKQELGRGQFAVVKKCHSRENAEHTAAAKFIKVKRSRGSRKGLSRELIEREAGILSAIKHEKIIQLYNVFDLGQEIVLVLELLSGGELFDKICECEFLTEIDACSYMRQVLEAIKYIHNLNIVHLDIKPENIVLQSKERPEIKLVDFGLSQRITPGEEVKEMMGTPEFVAPEIVNYEPIHTYTDMWAIGVLAFILLSGCSPFLGDDNQETYASICAVEYDFDEEYFAKISQHAKDFISSLLQKQPNKRLTAIECSEHPWLVTMSAPRPRTESIFIATARLKKYLARRRWQQSFQKLAAINRFSKFLKKGNATEMVVTTNEAQLLQNALTNLFVKKNDTTNNNNTLIAPKIIVQEPEIEEKEEDWYLQEHIKTVTRHPSLEVAVYRPSKRFSLA